MTGQAAQSHTPGVPAIGEVLAQKYCVERFVGKGGMGVVVAARHLQLGQTVAIKLLTLPPDEDRRDEAVGRFLHEAQAAARLLSEHVVRIYDVGQLDSGLPFMVMELLSGSDLGSLLDERGALPEAEAVDYVLQACAGIAEAHQMGIVHRDLKPSNLFVTRRSDGLPLVKVLDFGISKQLSDPASGEALPTFTNTRTLMGSPNYMSPEQIRDARRVDARTDVWALGIILQELITDAAVFHGESFPGVCAAIVADPPMPVRTMRPDVSEKLEAIINRCLEKDITRRYQNIAELVTDLAPLGARVTGSAAGSAPQPLVYSSGSRPVAAKVSSKATPIGAGLLEDRTIPMPLGPDVTLGHTGTLESARFGGTQNAVSVPDSRIELLTKPSGGASKAQPLQRWALPLAALALVLVGGYFWRSSSPATTAVSSAATHSSPLVATDAPFSLNIESDPPGAAVSEGSVRLGTTPFSISVSLPEGSSPRVFVLEKEGYEPYVVRQGAAHGPIRLQAALAASRPAAPSPVPSPQPAAAAPAITPPMAAAPPARVPRSPAPHPAAPPPKPPSDIRLER